MSIQRVKPQDGQESVWDYPRPPKIEPFSGHLRIVLAGQVICDSNQSFRILETSHPPTYYIPESDFISGALKATSGQSFCEFKGMAHYYDVESGSVRARKAAWGYRAPSAPYADLEERVAVYAHMMEACFVNDEQVQAQDGDFYGGWINSWIVGPFKGAPGTWGW
ncbi:MAG: DUF427 domain-containing protein [Bacteroidota bacterium]